MAWKDQGPYYEWDSAYTSHEQAARKAIELAEQYKIFTETVMDGDQFYITTQNSINEPHSAACRCERCLGEAF